MTALDLTTTEDIIIELKKRYPLLMIAGSVEISGQNAIDVQFYQGDVLRLIGLMHAIKTDLTAQYLMSLEPSDDNP